MHNFITKMLPTHFILSYSFVTYYLVFSIWDVSSLYMTYTGQFDKEKMVV